MSTLQLLLGSVLNTIVLVLHFNFARDARDCCNCYFGGLFFVALDKKSEFPCCFIEASSKIGKN